MATDNKYDRQLRLWGASGQAALGAAHVLCFGAGATATETLKNLVLPGIGAFTIVDGENVCDSDVASNFFIRSSDLGRPRAAVCAELLQELNPDARGFHRVARPCDVIEREGDYIDKFTLIIAANLDPLSLQRLGDLCWAKSIPLVAGRAFGMLGSVRLQLRRHEIVESKPDNIIWDLRLSEPFEELSKVLAAHADLESLPDHEHAHVPFVVILARLAARWKAEHNGTMPKTRDEKDAFKSWVPAGARMLQSKVPEMNFEEAEAHAYRAWSDPRELPYEAQQAIDAALADDVATATEFSLMVRCVAEFMRDDNGGLPPLPGAIPDCHADTQRYVALQQAYVARAKHDAAMVAQRYAALCQSLARLVDDAAAARLETVCKNFRDVKIVTTKSIAEEMASPDLAEAATALFEAEEEATKLQMPVMWYVALRAADRFYLKRQRWPGIDDAALEADASAVAAEIDALVIESGTDPSCFEGAFTPAHAREIARFGAAELHAIAAVIGGVASQEIVKVIVKQYTPIDHTYFFNGISCTATTLDI
mmetsp:Transcript_4260/g.13347  ORF Transcript_4260/g.13347 Transcript_4260/m.13347 type:complete len:538 (-) Transcript_4260:244-1857(-)